MGFVSKFRVPADLPAAGPAAVPARVLGTHSQLPDAAEFLVEVRDGRLHGLEAFCYQGVWPGDEGGFRLSAER